MHVVFLAGGIASGKSTAAQVMRECGAELIDLDDLSHQALAPWSPIIPQVVDAFGGDILRGNGTINREKLAARAFASTERAVTLEEIELPVIDDLMRQSIDKLREEEDAARAKDPDAPQKIVVVEVPLLDRMRGSFDVADEIVGVVCPLPARRVRAIGRGMNRADFERRREQQPSDQFITAHASCVFNNIRELDVFKQQIRDWWHEREAAGWAPIERSAGPVKPVAAPAPKKRKHTDAQQSCDEPADGKAVAADGSASESVVSNAADSDGANDAAHDDAADDAAANGASDTSAAVDSTAARTA